MVIKVPPPEIQIFESRNAARAECAEISSGGAVGHDQNVVIFQRAAFDRG